VGRKSVVNAYKIIDAVSLGATFTSGVTSTKNLDNIGLLVEWSGGGSPVGAITIEVQNGNSAWSALDFGTPISITGNSGNLNININQLPFENMRITYTRTSGTGSMTATLAAKVVGA